MAGAGCCLVSSFCQDKTINRCSYYSSRLKKRRIISSLRHNNPLYSAPRSSYSSDPVQSTRASETVRLFTTMSSTESYLPFENDGWSNKERATATCYCGEVQLSFVRNAHGDSISYSVPRLVRNAYRRKLTAIPACWGGRSCRYVHVQLHRLPQSDCLDVCVKLHR